MARLDAGRAAHRLSYVDRGKVMAVSVTTGPSSFMASSPTELFEGPYADNFDVAPDGQRFLMIKDNVGADQTATPASMVVVLNWLEELKARVGK